VQFFVGLREGTVKIYGKFQALVIRHEDADVFGAQPYNWLLFTARSLPIPKNFSVMKCFHSITEKLS